MKSTKFLKILVIVGLSLILMLMQFNIVLASDDDLFSNAFDEIPVDDNITDEDDENEIANEANDTDEDDENETLNNTLNGIAPTNTSRNISSSDTSTNRDVSNTNKLADTGLAQTGGTIALIVVVLVISAVYSYRKFDDYKKL